MLKPQTAVGVVRPFSTSRKTQRIQTGHLIYHIFERADRLMTALTLLRNSCTEMMVRMPPRNAAEILTRAEVALRRIENAMDRGPVATTKTRDVRQVPQWRLSFLSRHAPQVRIWEL
jgi:hypothetical protein